jgi:two-component system, NtrC family, response regulator HydG
MAMLDTDYSHRSDTSNLGDELARCRLHPTLEVVRTPAPSAIVARSAVMRKLVELSQRVARVDSTVLVAGESGSGKERIARLLHNESSRAKGPFIAFNCGALAETLLEAELFGHARGAFTGAGEGRLGLFEAAHGGTLFLDEVGEVSPSMQVKLLRVLQEREIRRVGENRSRKVDVRIVSATNRDLVKAVADGHFRQDLFYRLKVVELRVPSLREREEDILPLAEEILASVALRMGRKVEGISAAAAAKLCSYAWPGNIRELENTMERAVAIGRTLHVEVADLAEEVCRQQPLPSARITGRVRPLDHIEREYIVAALEWNNGNQSHTAEQLQIGSATLYRKLKSYGMIGLSRGLRSGYPIKESATCSLSQDNEQVLGG